LKSINNNGITPIILDLKMRIRLLDIKEEIRKCVNKLVERINIIEDSMKRKDWYEQLEEVKEYCKQLNGEELDATMLEIDISKLKTELLLYLDTKTEPKMWK
jgi:enolase